MVKQFSILNAKRLIVCLMMSVLFLTDISAQGYQPRRQDAYPSSYRQSSSQNQRTQDTFFSRFRQNSSQYQRNGSTRREYSNPFMKQDQNNNSSNKNKSSKRSANSREASRQISPSISNKKSADDVELIVTGEGRTKDDATKIALRSAIEQAFGTFVSSNTNILNDELVKDEIVTVSSGNVKKYSILSENEENGKWYITADVVVSIGNLIGYAKSKGAEAELAGATFAMDMRIKELNKKNEEIAIKHLTNQLSELFSTIFDYEIKIDEPKFDRYSNLYSVAVFVSVFVNKNVETCYNLFNNTLRSLSIGSESRTYEERGLSVFTIQTKNMSYNKNSEDINRSNPIKRYSLRSGIALHLLEQSMIKNICNFKLSDGIDTYTISMKDWDDHSYRSSTFDITVDKRKEWHQSGYAVKSKDDCFWLGYRNEGYLPILASPDYTGHTIAKIKFQLFYTLEELGKITKITILKHS